MQSYPSESRYKEPSKSLTNKTRHPLKISVESYLKRRNKRSVTLEKRKNGSTRSSSKRRQSAERGKKKNAFQTEGKCVWTGGQAMRIHMQAN